MAQVALRRRNGLVAVLLAISILPVLAIGVFAVVAVRDGQQDRVRDGQLALAGTLANDVEQDLAGAIAYTVGVVQRPGFRDFVTRRDRVDLREVTDRIATDGPYYDRLAIYDSGGQLLHSHPATATAARLPSVGDRDGGADVEVDDMRFERRDDGTTFTRLTLPVTSSVDESTTVGWLVAELSAGRVFASVLDARFGDTGYATIAARDGLVLASGDARRRGERLEAAELVEALAAAELRSVSYRSTISGHDEIAAVAPTAGGRAIVVTQARSEAFAADGTILKSLLAVLALTIAIAGAVAWSVSNRLRRSERGLRDNAEELASLNVALTESDRLKSSFLAMASHELRTPITAIAGFASTLRTMNEALSDEQRREFLGIIEQQAHRLERLVADLLTLSKVQRGALDTAPRPLDVSMAIKRAVRTVAGQDDVEIDCPAGISANADPDHLEQIVENLVTNAQKYGGRPIEVSVRQDGRWVLVRVCDHGAGVPPAFLDRLFEPFARAETHHDRPGTGLGLSIVRALAQAQGGDIAYEPVQPHGACFTARLPAADAEFAAAGTG